jgi:hypothetical protein
MNRSELDMSDLIVREECFDELDILSLGVSLDENKDVGLMYN